MDRVPIVLGLTFLFAAPGLSAQTAPSDSALTHETSRWRMNLDLRNNGPEPRS
jgi:hypothetical protein